MHQNQIYYRGSTIIFLPRPAPSTSTTRTDHRNLNCSSPTLCRPDWPMFIAAVSLCSWYYLQTLITVVHEVIPWTRTSPISPGRSTDADLLDSRCVVLYFPSHKGNPLGATQTPQGCVLDSYKANRKKNQQPPTKFARPWDKQLPARIRFTCTQHRAVAKRLSPVILTTSAPTFIPWLTTSKKSSEKQYSWVSQLWHSWLYYSLQSSLLPNHQSR